MSRGKTLGQKQITAVSVIIPTTGRPSVFAAIESVQRQAIAALEIIVVQDGVDEVTKAAILELSDTRIRVLTQNPPQGASAARNFGASQARGQYIALLDDDDLFLPTKLVSDLSLASRQLDNRFVIISSALVEWEGRREKWPRRFPKPGERWSDYLFARNWPARRPFLQTSCMFLPTKLMLEIPMNHHLRQHQDWDWLLDLEAGGVRLVAVQEALVQYQVHNPAGSISARTRWTSSLEWLQRRRADFSRETYSFFVAIYILDRARAEEGFSLPMLRTLLREFRVIGTPTATSWFFFLMSLLQLRPLLRNVTRKAYTNSDRNGSYISKLF